MGLYLVLCCLFPLVYAANSENLPQLYEPEKIKFIEGERLNIQKRKEQVNISNCSYFNGHFLCKDRISCIDLEDACNGVCNCLDCSDESQQCWNYDENLCRTCYHLCLPTPDGPQCICDADNFKFSPVCKEISECTKDNTCDQHCVRYEVMDRCSCGENYKGMPTTNGHTCISDVSYENRLLYSTDSKIKLLNFTAEKDFVVRDNVICKGLAAAHDDFYYGVAEGNSGYIYKTSIVTGKTDLVAETYSTLIFSIDVDWITGNIYFSTDKSLSVCSKDGQFCALLKQLEYEDSCHISVAPRSGLLFHSLRTIHHYYEDSKIMKSGMDGSDEKILVSEGLRHPMALTVDEFSQKLYWMDCDLGEVESIQFNGNNRKVWFSNSRLHIFTINKFEKNIFWTKEGENEIILDFETSSRIIVDKNASTVKYLYAYNPLLQQTEIPNPCKTTPCNNLCLLRPSQSEALDFTCLCDDYTPSSNKRWCNNLTAPVKWPVENDYEYEIPVRPPRSSSSNKATKWFNAIVLIILVSVTAFLIYRRRTVYRYYDRVCNWNWSQEEGINLNEYEEL